MLDTDSVTSEMKLWDGLGTERLKPFTGSDGIINAFDLLFSLRIEFPLHYTVFKQTASHRPHEGNAEDTFSLSGRLSNRNTHTNPSFLSTLVRINKNKKSKKPNEKECLTAYKLKHTTLPTLGEDVTDDEGEDDDNECYEADNEDE